MQINRLDSGRSWSIVLLLFLSQIINYFDKSVMGLAAPQIMKELRLTPEQYGFVASSFFSLYALSGVLVGFFVAHRVPSKWLLTALVLIWSVAQLPIVFFSSLTVLVVCRVILGIGEGPASPTATSAAHEWFSSQNRNMPTALLMLGASLGSLISGPVLSYVMIDHGWRTGFLLCSGLGLGWAVLWTLFGASGPEAASAALATPAKSSTIAQRRIWTDPTILGCIVVGFCAYWINGFAVAWLAPLIRLGLGYDAAATGWVISGVSAIGSISLITISFVSQRLLKSGTPSRIARGWINGACMLIGAASLAAAAFLADPAAKAALIAPGIALPLLTFTLGPAMVSEIVPASYRSRMLIMIYAGITLAGFLSPLVAGHVIGAGSTGGYDRALLVNALVALIGGVVAFTLLRPERSLRRFAALEQGR